MRDLINKVAVVTGGSRGIGKAIARVLLNHGMHVMIVSSGESAKKVASEFKNEGFFIHGLAADLENVDSAKLIIRECIECFGTLDLLVNDAGVAYIRSALEQTAEEFEKTLKINLEAPFLLSQEAAKYWISEKKEGSIVNIASQAAAQAFDGHAAYTASKAGLIAMTSVMALEWGKYGIRVNCISPGLVQTEMAAENWGDGTEVLKKLSLPRFAQSEEIGEGVVYLASDAARAITDMNLRIDSGPKHLF